MVYPKLIRFFAQADNMSTIISASRALENIVDSNRWFFKKVRELTINDRKTGERLNIRSGGEFVKKIQ